jgi:hypothetical protein
MRAGRLGAWHLTPATDSVHEEVVRVQSCCPNREASQLKKVIVRYTVAVACVVTCNAATAQQSAFDVAERWGLPGTWALRCDRPPSPENTHITYERTDGAFVVRSDAGPLGGLGEVRAAALADDGGIELTIAFKKFATIQTNHIAKNADGQIRAIWNRDDKGNYTVKDGKMTGSGWPSLLLTRCKAGI